MAKRIWMNANFELCDGLDDVPEKKYQPKISTFATFKVSLEYD